MTQSLTAHLYRVSFHDDVANDTQHFVKEVDAIGFYECCVNSEGYDVVVLRSPVGEDGRRKVLKSWVIKD